MKKKVSILIFLITIIFSVIAIGESIDGLIEERDKLLTQLSAINEKIAIAKKSTSPEGSLGKICDLFPDEGMALTVRDSCGKFSIQQEVTAEDLKSVKSLEPAYDVKIKDLSGIGYLTELTSIRLDWYRGEFEELPDEMRNCSKLMFLDIPSTGLTKLPDWIGELTGLWRIDVNNNNLEDLPDTICNLVNLDDLDISSNKAINKLPENIGNLVSLKSLNISYTSISELPESIYALDLNEIKMDDLPIK